MRGCGHRRSSQGGTAAGNRSDVVSVADVAAHLALPVGNGLEDAITGQQDLAAMTTQKLVVQAVAETRLTAERAAGRIRALFPGWKVSSDCPLGSRAGEIIHAA